LQSDWLLYHVITSFVSYGAFAVSFAVSIIYLIKYRAERRGSEGSFVNLFPDLKNGEPTGAGTPRRPGP
jgi:ABC-type transport system involved in cytochrome c biogenesis permease subunit